MWTLVHEANPRILALEMSAVPDLEYTALKALTAAEQKLREAGTTVWLVALNPRVRDVIDRAPLGKTLGCDRILPTLGHALETYQTSRSSEARRVSLLAVAGAVAVLPALRFPRAAGDQAGSLAAHVQHYAERLAGGSKSSDATRRGLHARRTSVR
jgi:hypothetical protein